MANLTQTAKAKLEENADLSRQLRGFVHATPRADNQRNTRYAKSAPVRAEVAATPLKLKSLPKSGQLRDDLIERDKTPPHIRARRLELLRHNADKLVTSGKLKEYGDALKVIRHLTDLERYQIQS